MCKYVACSGQYFFASEITGSLDVYDPFEWKGMLTNWGWVTHICVGNLTIIGSLDQNQWWYIVNWTLGTNSSEISVVICTFSFKKMHLKMSSGKWQPFWNESWLWYPHRRFWELMGTGFSWHFTVTRNAVCLLPRDGAFDLGLAVSVPLPIVTGIFVLLWFQSRLT